MGRPSSHQSRPYAITGSIPIACSNTAADSGTAARPDARPNPGAPKPVAAAVTKPDAVAVAHSNTCSNTAARPDARPSPGAAAKPDARAATDLSATTAAEHTLLARHSGCTKVSRVRSR